MSSLKEHTMWKSDGIAFNTGNGAHQWFTKNNGILSNSTQLADDPATGGIWTEIPMAGFDYLRVFGSIVITDIGSWTAGQAGLMPYAFGRYTQTPSEDLVVMPDDDNLLGANVGTATANEEGGATRLTCSTLQFNTTSGETSSIRFTQNWSNATRIHTGTAANETQPIIKFSGAAVGDVRHWWYDIGPGYDLSGGAPYQHTINPGVPRARLSGFEKIYVALKVLNEGAWTGSGDFEIGGHIRAVAYSKHPSFPR